MGRSRFSGLRSDGANRSVARNAIVVLILSALPPIALSYVFRLNAANSVTLIVGVCVPVYIAWWQAHSGTPGDGGPVPEALEKLAGSVREQWDKEYKTRTFRWKASSFRDIPTSWSAADDRLAVRWDKLRKDAEDKGMRSDGWATGPHELSGSGKAGLLEALEKVPTGWMVVLGESGSGKTMLMILAVLEIIERRDKGKGDDAVPVIMSMTTWNPWKDTLREWMEKQLLFDYPDLGKSMVRTLLDERKIIPVLDGLDEIPDPRQAIAKLNDAFKGPSRPPRLLVTCRTDAYARAIDQPMKTPEKVWEAAAIELHPMSVSDVSNYLSKDGCDPRWERVTEQLSRMPGGHLAKALNTPLYASLAYAIYNSTDDDQEGYGNTGNLRDPANLCKFPSEADIQRHLLDEFIPVMYAKERGDGGEEDGRPPAEHWLEILAHYMKPPSDEDKNNTKNRDNKYLWDSPGSLEWWKLRQLAPPWLVPAVIGVVCGLAAAFPAAVGTQAGAGIGIGSGVGMMIAVAIGALVLRRPHRGAGKVTSGRTSPATVMEAYDKRDAERHPGVGMAGGVIGALIGGLAAGLAGRYHIGHEESLFSGVPEALGMALGAGASTDFWGGLTGVLVGAFVGGYLTAVGQGLPAGVVDGLGVGIAAAVFIGQLGRHNPSSMRPRWVWKTGIPGGGVVGLAIGLIVWRAAGIPYGIAFGLLIAALVAVPFGLAHKDANLRNVPLPGDTLANDAKAFWFTALSAGLAAGATGFIGTKTSIAGDHANVNMGAVIGDSLRIGISSALVIGLAFGFYHAATPAFRITTWWLAIRRRVPWRLVAFLEKAYELSVLRMSGASYQFRHGELQVHLAAKYDLEQAQRQRPGALPGTGLPPQEASQAELSPEPAETLQAPVIPADPAPGER